MKVNWPVTLFIYFLLTALALAFTVLTYSKMSTVALLAFASAEARICLFLMAVNLFATVLRRRAIFWPVLIWAAAIVLTVYEVVSFFIFQLTRISIAHNIRMLLAGGQGVRTTLETLGSLTVPALLIDGGLFIVGLSILIYLLLVTERMFHPATRHFAMRGVARLFFALITFVILEQVVSFYYKKPSLWRVEQQNFPFYPDLFHPDFARETAELKYSITLSPSATLTTDPVAGSVKLPKSPSEKKVPLKNPSAQVNNVFFFIVESFAKRFVSPETTPHLLEFAKDSLAFQQTLANANGTHHAWYAILTSDFPLRFLQKTKSEDWYGSPALRVLKDAGFELKVFDSAGFNYLNYDHIILGDIFPSTEIFSPPLNIQSQWDKTDVWANDKLIDEVSRIEGKGRRFFLSFPGATHFPYFSPKEAGAPPEETIDYFRILYSPAARDVLTRRYRKAAGFFDAEFGRFIKALKAKGLYDDAIIVVTGDHGEELLEKKVLGHGSFLTQEHISTPIYIKIPGKASGSASGAANSLPNGMVADLISQVDILPTLFEALGLGDKIADAHMVGHSRLHFEKHGYSLTSSVNRFRDNPNDFVISDGHAKIHFMLDLRPQTYSATTLTLGEMTDMEDEPLPVNEQSANEKRKFFEHGFAPALEKMGVLKFN